MDNTLEQDISSHALNKNISPASLFLFALPSIITMVFMSLYSMVDGVFVARLVGTDALSSINIVFPIIIATIAFATMLGSGGNAIIAKKIGEGKIEEARENFSTVVWTTFIMAVIFCLLCFVFLNPILRFLGANNDILGYCRDYAIFTLIFLPFTMFGMVFQTFFITEGKSHYSLVFTVIGGISNIILDYVFIKIMGIGIIGAAIATGIGYTIPGAFGLVYFSFNRKGALYLIKPKFNRKLLTSTCINGSSEMVSTISAAVVTLLLNNVLMRMIGVDGVAAVTVVLYVQDLLNAVFMGYSMGVAPLISFNYGKKDPDRLHKIFSISIKSILILCVCVFVFGTFKGDLLVSIFADKNSNVYALGVNAVKLFSCAFLFMGINLFSSSLFTAFSNGKISAVISFLRTLVFVVISVLILPLIIGVNGVWLSVPLAEFLAIMVSIYFLRKYKSIYHYA